MKQLLFSSILAMFIMISATTHAQTLQYPKKVNGQWVNSTIDAKQQYQTPSGVMTGQQVAEKWAQAYQAEQAVPAQSGSVDLPSNGSTVNQQNNAFVAADNQLTLENKALQNEKLKAETKMIRTTNTLNTVATVANVTATGFQIYNNTRMTGANVEVLRAQAGYIRTLGNSSCCGNNGNGTVTGTYPAPNPIYTPPAGTVFYDNRDGLGPFYIAANGQRVYTVPNPGTPINYGYAGQTPTNNGNAGWTNGYQNPVYNPYQQPIYNHNSGGSYGGNWDPNTNSMPAGYAHGVRTY